MKEKYGRAALFCLLISVLLADSPVWFIGGMAIIAAAVCAYKGQLWDWKE